MTVLAEIREVREDRKVMGLFDIFRRQSPIRDAAELAEFIDRQAAFLTQKGIYEYARARAGHYAKVLFKEPEFQAACDVSRWQAFPIGLVMVAEVAAGVLRPLAGDEELRQRQALIALVLDIFDRYPVPAAIGQGRWSELRAELDQRLKLVGFHAPKWAKDVPEQYAESYFNLGLAYQRSARNAEAVAARRILAGARSNAGASPV